MWVLLPLSQILRGREHYVITLFMQKQPQHRPSLCI